VTENNKKEWFYMNEN